MISSLPSMMDFKGSANLNNIFLIRVYQYLFVLYKTKLNTITMKMTHILSSCFLVIILFLKVDLKAADTDSVSVWFIGSHGYLLESSEKKVALDALIYWDGSYYEYIKPPLALNQKMKAAKAPFDSLDLILIGHAHKDHFNAETVERSMLKNQNAILVTTPEIRSNLASKVDSFSHYSDRIWAPQLEFRNSKDTTINEIPITITCIAHGNENMDLFVFSFVMDNIRFLHMNSWNSLTATDYDTLAFNKERADVAFLGYDYIMDPNKFVNFSNHIHPIFSTIGHVDGASSGRINQIENKISQYKADYPMNMLSIPMEKLLYKKLTDTILVDTLNRAPVFTETIPNQEVKVNEAFSYTIPASIAIDPEDGSIDLLLTRSNGTALPDWLNFDEQTLELSGVPETALTLGLRLSAADTNLAISFITFSILITEPLALTVDPSDELRIYPVPVTDILNIEVPSSFGKIEHISLVNVEGKIVFSNSEVKGSIDLSKLPSGFYTLRLVTANKIYNRKIILQ